MDKKAGNGVPGRSGFVAVEKRIPKMCLVPSILFARYQRSKV
jgi:hypothetical protein